MHFTAFNSFLSLATVCATGIHAAAIPRTNTTIILSTKSSAYQPSIVVQTVSTAGSSHGTFSVPYSSTSPWSAIASKTVRSASSTVTTVSTGPTKTAVAFGHKVTDDVVNEIYQRGLSDDLSDHGAITGICVVVVMIICGLFWCYCGCHQRHKSNEAAKPIELPSSEEPTEPPASAQPGGHSQPSQPNTPSTLQEASAAVTIFTSIWNLIAQL